MMKEETNALGRFRPLLFLLPAILTAALIFGTLPLTVPVLSEIPLRLELPEIPEPPIVIATEPPETTAPQVLGNYTDGVYTGSARGYGGTVKVQVTVENGQIVDVTILSASSETASFWNRALAVIDLVYQQQTWEVDTVSGATYSCNGILGAIQNALTGEAVVNKKPTTSTPSAPAVSDTFEEPAAYLDGTYTGTARGFGGDITVSVTITDGKIASIVIVSASGETKSYMARAEAVIPKILESGSPNVDTVSGATYSSNGIINAVKRALNQAASDDSLKEDVEELPPETEPTSPTEPTEPPVTDPSVMPEEPLIDGVYTGTGEGFGGEIVVQVTVENGRIASVEILSAEDETPDYFERAKGLIPFILSTQSTQVDVISGATFSSEGILEAVEDALAQAAVPEETQPTEPTEPSEPTEPTEPPAQGAYTDGTYSATGWCQDVEGYFRYELTVSVSVSNGFITAVDVVRGVDESEFPEDNDRYLDYAINGRERKGVAYPGVPQQIIDSQSPTGVDTVSGATYSSLTIADLASQALGLTGGPEEAEPTDPTDPTEPPLEDPARYADGSYSATGWCEDEEGWFRYELIVSMTIQDSVISAIDVVWGQDESEVPEDNEKYLNYAINGRERKGVFYPGIPQQVLDEQSADAVDIISGATYSSNTILGLIRQMLTQAVEAAGGNG